MTPFFVTAGLFMVLGFSIVSNPVKDARRSKNPQDSIEEQLKFR